MRKATKTNIYFLALILFYIFMIWIVVPILPIKKYNGTISVIIGQSIVIIPTIIYLFGTGFKPLKEIPFHKISPLNILLIILFTYCMLPLISLINSLSMIFTTNRVASTMADMNSNPLIVNLFLCALLPAFVEEISFRGIIYHGYRDSVIKKAILTSALLFGLFHMNINQFLYAFFMGLIFAYMIEATGSIFSSIIMHFTFNANSVLMMNAEKRILKWNKNLSSEEVNDKISDAVSKTQDSLSYKTATPGEILSTIIPLVIAAVIFSAISVMIFKCIAKRCKRDRHIRTLLPFKNRLDEALHYVCDDEYVEPTTQEYGGKIVDVFFVIAFSICIGLMIFVMLN